MMMKLRRRRYFIVKDVGFVELGVERTFGIVRDVSSV